MSGGGGGGRIGEEMGEMEVEGGREEEGRGERGACAIGMSKQSSALRHKCGSGLGKSRGREGRVVRASRSGQCVLCVGGDMWTCAFDGERQSLRSAHRPVMGIGGPAVRKNCGKARNPRDGFKGRVPAQSRCHAVRVPGEAHF